MARILVIDDQEPIRRIVRRALEQAGHDVLDASDGEMGMEILARHSADVVITDIFMPGQDGIVTLREIRKRFPTVKVIVSRRGEEPAEALHHARDCGVGASRPGDLVGGKSSRGRTRTCDP